MSSLINQTIRGKCLSNTGNSRVKRKVHRKQRIKQTSRVTRSDAKGRKKITQSERQFAKALCNGEDHYFLKPAQQKSWSVSLPLGRTFAVHYSTVSNGIVRHYVFTMNTSLLSPCEKWRGLINLPWCSHAVALLPLCGMVHRTEQTSCYLCGVKRNRPTVFQSRQKLRSTSSITCVSHSGWIPIWNIYFDDILNI